MKKGVTIIILLLIVALFGGALYYLYQKNNQAPEEYTTENPTTETIVRKTVATGTIKPREEVEVKPNISGIIDKMFVKPGDSIKAGDMVAQLKVVPNITNLNTAKNQMRQAKINLDNERRVFERQKELYEKKVISANDYDLAKNQFDNAKQNLVAAEENFEIIQTGTTMDVGNAATTEIKATISGMVLSVPVKIGTQVIEANNFNEGTTLATIAKVDDMIFEGKIDESEVGKIEEGLPLEITIGALQGQKFEAILDYISPQGVEENSAVQFDIEGTLLNSDKLFIRSGLSANASIILEKAENVLAVKEGLLQFDRETKTPYVEIEKGEQQFERRDVEIGLSNGVHVEIKSGLSEKDKIKVWNKVQQEPKQGRRRG